MRGHSYLVYGATALVLAAATACDGTLDSPDDEVDAAGTTSPSTAGTTAGGPTGGDTAGQTSEGTTSDDGQNGEITGGDTATGTSGLNANGQDTAGTSGGETGGSGTTNGTSGGETSDTATGGGDGIGETGGDSDGESLVNPGPGDALFVGANFWNIDWEGSEGYFKTGTDFATTSDPWHPQFLKDLAPYSVLRFMDWNKINFEVNEQATWATRKQKTSPQNEPVAFEWQIDLCNRMQTDYWVNVPHQASAAYWTQLAELIQDELDPGLRVYVEFSNETWNNQFPQAVFASAQGSSMGLSGSNPSASYTVYQSVRVFEAFELVFGYDNPRLVKVLAGQAAWSGVCESQMAALNDPVINPNDVMPDAFAIAPYFGGTSIPVLAEEVDVAIANTEANKGCTDKVGVPLITYEGGQDSFAAGGTGCGVLQRDPAMYELYTDYLDGLAGILSGPYVQYTHSGVCWGLLQNTGDSLDISPKYRAVVDWLAAQP